MLIYRFSVTRPKDIVEVWLVRNKEKPHEFQFVNISKGHICPCKFKTFGEAVKDMSRLKSHGKIIHYERLPDFNFEPLLNTTVSTNEVLKKNGENDMTINLDEVKYDEDVEVIRRGIKYKARLSKMADTFGFSGSGVEIQFSVEDSARQNEALAEKDAIINFLKKELIHKTSYRQVMKRQYRELKQQADADNKRHAEMYADLVQKNFLLRKEIEELKKKKE